MKTAKAQRLTRDFLATVDKLLVIVDRAKSLKEELRREISKQQDLGTGQSGDQRINRRGANQ